MFFSLPIEDDLDFGDYEYETETQGERHQGAARLAAEGWYSIQREEKHGELAYALELPAEPGEVQRALGIEREGRFITTVMNPVLKRRAGYCRPQADFPPVLQAKFGDDRKFAPLEPGFLDHRRAELILIAARPTLHRAQPGSPNVTRAQEALRQVGLPPTAAFLRPLLHGAWT